jgi:hypothetical protein
MKRKETETEVKAAKLLRSPKFFSKLLAAVARNGLVGEERNALVLYIVGVSRLLKRPLNVLVKGSSSAGKNFLITAVLRLFPKHCVREITSSSLRAWNYAANDFQHRIVYIQERNEAAGTVRPLRLLISEGKLKRTVTVSEKGLSRRTTKTFITRGPVAAISTTTRDEIEIDDETRHASIWVDESVEQTRRIAKRKARPLAPLTKNERAVWFAVQRLLEDRIGAKVLLPEWFDELAEMVFVEDIRARRYWPAFLEACRAVCFLRSAVTSTKYLEVKFSDFAIAAFIFEPVFTQSIQSRDDGAFATREQVEEISKSRSGAPVSAKQLVKYTALPKDKVYAQLRRAVEQGTLVRVNKPEKGNRKLYLPAAAPRFLPDPAAVFQKIKSIPGPVELLHPITGERLRFKR